MYARCFLWRQNNPEVNYFPNRISGGGVFLEEMPCRRYDKKKLEEMMMYLEMCSSF
jgi:hypothetical protein